MNCFNKKIVLAAGLALGLGVSAIGCSNYDPDEFTDRDYRLSRNADRDRERYSRYDRDDWRYRRDRDDGRYRRDRDREWDRDRYSRYEPDRNADRNRDWE
jgi:hypothetical protein